MKIKILTFLVLLTLAHCPAHAQSYVVEIQGFGGYPSGWLLPEVEARLTTGPAIDFAFVMVGTNDLGNPFVLTPPDTFKENLRQILQALHDADVQVFVSEIPPQIDSVVMARKPWLTEPPNVTVAAYNVKVHEAAALTSPTTAVVPMFDYFMPHTIVPEDWMRAGDDGVHPTLDGCRAIADRYADFLLVPQSHTKRIVLFGDSIMRAQAYGGEPNRPGDFLASRLNRNAALDWLFFH